MVWEYGRSLLGKTRIQREIDLETRRKWTSCRFYRGEEAIGRGNCEAVGKCHVGLLAWTGLEVDSNY